MSDLTAGLRGLGQVQQVTPTRMAAGTDRLDEAIRLAEISGDHIWIALLTHLVADPDRGAAGDLMLDAESLVSAHLGCYVCEQPYTPRLRRRRCPGEPGDAR